MMSNFLDSYIEVFLLWRNSCYLFDTIFLLKWSPSIYKDAQNRNMYYVMMMSAKIYYLILATICHPFDLNRDFSGSNSNICSAT